MLTLLLLLAAQQPNVVVVMADDFGVDRVGAYAEHPDPGRTPNINRLADLGVLYRHAYANPVCSPTRATIMTGRYGYRTGIVRIISQGGGQPELQPGEVTLFEALPTGYDSRFVGKWHLGNGTGHPGLVGVPSFWGTPNNLGPGDYYVWTKHIDGTLLVVNNYATTEQTDDAISFMDNATDPFVLTVFYHAAHIPVHTPPLDLTTYDAELAAGDQNDPLDRPLFVRSWIEAMDTELGRLMDSLPSNTYLIFCSDNGTQKLAVDGVDWNPNRAKGTLYEGGINVPLIIFGPNVPAGEECPSLVNFTDIYATVIDLVGGTSLAEDSVSLVPTMTDPSVDDHRAWVFSEIGQVKNAIIGRVAGVRWKLLDFPAGDELYNLDTDPWELSNELIGPMTDEERTAWIYLEGQLPVE